MQIAYDKFRESNVRKLEKIENENKLLMSKIKRIVKPNNTKEIKMEEAVKRLEAKISEIDKTIDRVKKKEGEIFEKITNAVKEHDTHKSEVFSEELKQVRKTASAVIQTNLALKQIALRLTTVKDLKDIATTMSPAVKTLKMVDTKISSAISKNEILEINNEVGKVLEEIGNIKGLDINHGDNNEDAKKILDEALIVANRDNSE